MRPDICPACGWYAHTKFNNTECNPAMGEAVASLQQAIPDVSSTKLGYGSERITFEIGKALSVGFDVRNQPFVFYKWKFLHSLDHLSHDDTLDLVRVLRDWHTRCLARKTT